MHSSDTRRMQLQELRDEPRDKEEPSHRVDAAKVRRTKRSRTTEVGTRKQKPRQSSLTSSREPGTRRAMPGTANRGPSRDPMWQGGGATRYAPRCELVPDRWEEATAEGRPRAGEKERERERGRRQGRERAQARRRGQPGTEVMTGKADAGWEGPAAVSPMSGGRGWRSHQQRR